MSLMPVLILARILWLCFTPLADSFLSLLCTWAIALRKGDPYWF